MPRVPTRLGTHAPTELVTEESAKAKMIEEEVSPRHTNSAEVTSAEKMRAFRARARKKKLCIGCGQVKPRKGKTKCADCSEAAKAAVYRAREAAAD